MITFISEASGEKTATMPAHQAGDFIFVWAYRDNSVTPPVAPSGEGWINLHNSTGSNTNSGLLAYKVATSSSETVGTFLVATTVNIVVYRPSAYVALSIGSMATQGGTGSVVYPAINLQNKDNTSWVLAFAGHRSTNTTLQTPPPGMVLRANTVDASDETAVFDTDGAVNSWTSKTVAMTGDSSGWRTVVMELKATATVVGRRRSTWISLID